MAGQGNGAGKVNMKLDSQIDSLKYALLFMNIIGWLVAAAIFGMTLWLRFDNGISDLVSDLEVAEFYIGVYILILASLVVMAISFLGCGAALAENPFLITIYLITQIVSFLLALMGSATLLEFSTYDSSIQPLIRESMRKLIIASGHHDPSRLKLALIQENIGCCGADGPNDYLTWRQPMPSTCRDSVTGNAYFYGCVDEMTWFFEEKAGWVAALAMSIGFINIMNAVVALVLQRALKKESEVISPYHR